MKNNRERSNLDLAKQYLSKHPFFKHFYFYVSEVSDDNKQNYGYMNENGHIFINKKANLSVNQIVYIISLNIMHIQLTHYDHPKGLNIRLYNIACNIHAARFLYDLKIPGCIFDKNVEDFPINDNQMVIYEYLNEHPKMINDWTMCAWTNGDMSKLGNHKINKQSFENTRENFEQKILIAANEVIGGATCSTMFESITSWFITNYPLFGAIAAGIKIVDDIEYCKLNQIKVAAIDMDEGIIYVNTENQLSKEEWLFVVAHEYLHAGLNHHQRINRRNRFLWNVACDYVINGWLYELGIGKMPTMGILYDVELKDMSAEEIYEQIIRTFKNIKDYQTLAGFGYSDIRHKTNINNAMNLDEFYRRALSEGMLRQEESGRGYIPKGLKEAIKAINVPVLPWDIKLAKWLDCYISDEETVHTYSRLSRRQSSSPDIMRPGKKTKEEYAETFGAIIDTSGSMTKKDIGIAIGAISNYALSKGVKHVRIVYCDAIAYDAGYIDVNDLLDTVEVTGRGGTRLQPAIDLLEKLNDFPIDAPILIITDGEIESSIRISRVHAYLIKEGHRLPFNAKTVFYYNEY